MARCVHEGSIRMRSPSDRVVVWTCPECDYWLIIVDGEVLGIGNDTVGELVEAMDDLGERVEGAASRELREFAAGFTARNGAHGERADG